MRHRQPQELVGIDWSVLDANFVVEVWTSAATAQPDVSDGVAAAHVLSGYNCIAGKMAVAGGDSVAVIQGDCAPVAAHKISEGYHGIGRRYDWLSVRSRDVNSSVESALTVERINSLSERSRDRTFDRPKVRS